MAGWPVTPFLLDLKCHQFLKVLNPDIPENRLAEKQPWEEDDLKKKKVETIFKLHPFYIQAGPCRKSVSKIETQTFLPFQGSAPGTEQLLSLLRAVSGREAEASFSQEVGD